MRENFEFIKKVLAMLCAFALCLGSPGGFVLTGNAVDNSGYVPLAIPAATPAVLSVFDGASGTITITVTDNTAFADSLKAYIYQVVDNTGGDPIIPVNNTLPAVRVLKINGGAGSVISGASADLNVVGEYASYLGTLFPGITALDLSEYKGAFGVQAFRDATRLKSVKLPAGASIPAGMFKGCVGLTSVDLSSCHPGFGNSAFEDCVELTAVKLPVNAALSSGLFKGCVKLTGVYAGDVSVGIVDLSAVISFGESVFENCVGIREVRLPASVALSAGIFKGCTGLNAVYTGSKTAGAIDLRLYTGGFAESAFRSCTGISALYLPNVSGLFIPAGMFYHCASMRLAVLPDTPPGLGNEAFYATPKNKLLLSAGSNNYTAAQETALNGKFPAITGESDVDLGDSFELAVSPTASGLTYRWYREGTAVGGDSASYSVLSAALSDSGAYTCVLGLNSHDFTTEAFELAVAHNEISLQIAGATSAVLGEAPGAKTVTVKNFGNRLLSGLAVSLSGTDAASFTLSETVLPDLAASAETTFTITPKSDLAAKTYNAAVTVENAVVGKSLDFIFTVVPPQAPVIETSVNNGSSDFTAVRDEANLASMLEGSAGSVTLTLNEAADTSAAAAQVLKPATGGNLSAAALESWLKEKSKTFRYLINISLEIKPDGGVAVYQPTKPLKITLNIPQSMQDAKYFYVLHIREDGSTEKLEGESLIHDKTANTLSFTVTRLSYFAVATSETDPNTPEKPDNPNKPDDPGDSDNSDNSSNSSSGRNDGWYYRESNSPSWLSQSGARTLIRAAQRNGQWYVRTQSLDGEYGAMRAALQAVGRENMSYRHESVSFGEVLVRLDIPEPGLATKDILVSGRVSGVEQNAALRRARDRWPDADLSAVVLDHDGSFGVDVQVAAKANLNGLDTNSLYFYVYDGSARAFRRVSAEYAVDGRGYLHFTTGLGGSVIISDIPLSGAIDDFGSGSYAEAPVRLPGGAPSPAGGTYSQPPAGAAAAPPAAVTTRPQTPEETGTEETPELLGPEEITLEQPGSDEEEPETTQVFSPAEVIEQATGMDDLLIYGLSLLAVAGLVTGVGVWRRMKKSVGRAF